MKIKESLIIFISRAKNQMYFLIHKIIRLLKGFDIKKSVTVLTHEGLGDLIAILPALKNLEERGVQITLLTDISKWRQVENSFFDVPKLKIQHFISNGSYIVPRGLDRQAGGAFVALGHYSNFPIVEYPCSFFWQLDVNQDKAKEFLRPKLINLTFKLPKPYVFIDLNTSTGRLFDSISLSEENTVTSLSNTEILINKLGEEERFFIEADTAFAQKIVMALNAEKVICSDAGLFNALIRVEKRPELIVHSRKHRHSHCTEIYQKCKFDGEIYRYLAK